jgi:hypothetical protein
MRLAFELARDVFAIIGVLWLALAVLFAMNDAAKHKGED